MDEVTRHKEIMKMMATNPDAVADMLVAWETEISKVMPADYKDWWQNSKLEWPMVARMTIESLREREQLAWDKEIRECGIGEWFAQRNAAFTVAQDKLAWEMLDKPIELVKAEFKIKGK